MNKQRTYLSISSKIPLLLRSLLFLALLHISHFGHTQCTYTVSGIDNTNYTISSGDTICIIGNGQYTGTINLYGGVFLNNSSLPQTFGYNTSGANPSSHIINYGSIAFTSSQNMNDSLVIFNYGTINYTNLSINSSATVTNFGTMNLSSYLNINGILTNQGTMNVSGDFNSGLNSDFDNQGEITANSFDISGDWTNSSKMITSGYSEFKSSSIGYLDGGCITTNSFTNRGFISGTNCGDIIVSTASANTTGASLLGSIAIIDLTPPGSAPFLDMANGVIGGGVVWTSCVNCGFDEICGNGYDDNSDGRTDEPYPGGVQVDMQLWLKAETGTNTTTDGLDITSWADQSVNGYTAAPNTNSADDPIYATNAINYNPGIEFDGTYTDNFSDGLHLGTDFIFSANKGIHVFVVCDPNVDGKFKNYPFDFGHNPNGGYGLTYTDSHYGSYSTGDSLTVPHAFGDEAALLELEINFNDFRARYRNGNLVGSDPITISELTAANINDREEYGTIMNSIRGPVSIGRKSASSSISSTGEGIFNGPISEVLVYNDSLSSEDKEKINAYLAVKYGITLNHDYVSSSGTLFKDVSDGYAQHVTIIGRDDCSGLNQKQSKPASAEGILSIALNTHGTSNASHATSFTLDESFLSIAHDGTAINASWTPANNDYASLDRVWKFDATNYNQTIEFSLTVDNPNFDLPSMPVNADGNYYLLFGADADFTTGGIYAVALSNFDGNMTYSEPLTLPNSQYFTIGVLINPEEICSNGIDDNSDGRTDEPYPGGVQSDMQLWLKGDVGTNTQVDGNDVISWADQSSNGYSADADVNSTDDPTFTENAINFNPGVNFDGTYTDPYSDGLHLGDDYIFAEKDGLHVFVVCDPDISPTTDKHVFDFGLAANGGYGMIYSDNDYGMYTNNTFGGTNTELFHSSGDAPALVEFKVDFDDAQEFYRNNILLNSTAVTIPDLDQSKVNEAAVYGPLTGTGSTNGPVSIGRKSASVYLDQNGGRLFAGRISEVLVYTDTLSSIEKQKINSYLAIKYGIALNHNYISSAESIKKDISDGYANDIAGIGIDNCSGLHQKQSKSVESDAIITVGKGTIASTNDQNPNTVGTDGTYLIWGNDDGGVTSWNASAVNIPGTDLSRIDRIWKFTEHFNVTNVMLQVEVDNSNLDLPMMPVSADGIYYLLEDDDGDFTNGGTTYTPMSLVSLDEWQALITDPMSNYFSIGVGNVCSAQAPVLSK